MTRTTKRGACAVVLDEAGRVLLVKREDFRLWVLPGGGLEDGETAEAAAVRETEEETRLPDRHRTPRGALHPARRAAGTLGNLLLRGTGCRWRGP